MPLPVSLERELHPTVLDLTSRITLRLPIFSRNENAKDDFYTQSLIVMPGCTLEVWDKDTSPESKRELWHRFLSLNVSNQEREASGMLRRRKRREQMLAI